MGNSHELTSLPPYVPGVPPYLIHSHSHALETTLDLWKMVYLTEKQLLSVFSIQHSASSDAFHLCESCDYQFDKRPGL